MDAERFQILLSVIELGSLSAAAEKLGYTPSGISRMMAALEEETGFPLLIRQRDGVVPTEDCLALLPSIREFLFYGDKCRQTAARIRGLDVGTVTIGTAYSAYHLWLAKAAAVFHKKYPGIKIEILYGYSTELLSMLKEHKLSLCIISEREGEHSWIPLRKDEMMALIPANHPMAEKKRIPLSLFAQEPYIETYPGRDIDNTRVFERCGISPKIQFTTTDNLATFSMVEAGLGISMNNALNCILWEERMNSSVKILPLEPPQIIELGIAYEKNAPLATKRFLDYIQERLGQEKGL